jgi:hypothetical protein
MGVLKLMGILGREIPTLRRIDVALFHDVFPSTVYLTLNSRVLSKLSTLMHINAWNISRNNDDDVSRFPGKQNRETLQGQCCHYELAGAALEVDHICRPLLSKNALPWQSLGH